ncbi:site-specific DNA-methyltransferase [Caulobacter sp. KR2-114]|uniref:site-specific DNA-methyltransferase n=1 Tax=Caulobacter sp. KR2-114 TaxID=3400912 RepID=UPI003BFAA0A7
MTGRYDHLGREELIALMERRDASRKLGLVWERDELEHDAALNDDFVLLHLDQDLSIGAAPFENFLIEGDNFDALRYLQIAYKGRVKCIYIDPPYNTGNKDFLYNDAFVDKEDAYRHSKWLEYMFRRLSLAKDLLAEDGVIFVSVDDIENAHLTLLMDQVFPGRRVGTFVWRRRSGAGDAKDWFLSVDHEYVVCYANRGFSFAGSPKDLSTYSNPDGDKRGDWVNDNLVKAHNFKQRPDAFYPIQNPDTGVWYPGDPDNVWRFATKARLNGRKIRTKTMEQLIAEKRLLWPKDDQVVVYDTVEQLRAAIEDGSAPRNLQVYLQLDDLRGQVAAGQAPARLLDNIAPIEEWVGRKIGYSKPRYKRFAKDLKSTEQPVSTWIVPAATKKSELEELSLDEVTAFTVGYTSEGTKLLSQMLANKDFPYPKPLSLLKSLIAQATDPDRGDIVLDFFAGSGTTGHAVLALNDEDGGDRSFILVSTTEANADEPSKNVCRDITQRRLRAAIEGYSYRTPKGSKSVAGVAGEFAYLRAERVPRESVAIDIQHGQVWTVLQQLHANAISAFDPALELQILEGEGSGPDLIYVPQLTPSAVAALRDRVERISRPAVVYSWQSGLVLQEIKASYVRVEQIPDYLIARFGGVGA